VGSTHNLGLFDQRSDRELPSIRTSMTRYALIPTIGVRTLWVHKSSPPSAVVLLVWSSPPRSTPRVYVYVCSPLLSTSPSELKLVGSVRRALE